VRFVVLFPVLFMRNQEFQSWAGPKIQAPGYTIYDRGRDQVLCLVDEYQLSNKNGPPFESFHFSVKGCFRLIST
jgi:hypothetical protein